jgi:hypothetical protein
MRGEENVTLAIWMLLNRVKVERQELLRNMRAQKNHNALIIKMFLSLPV